MSTTQIRVGLERGVEGRSLAWALDYPGAFAYGSDDAEALLNLPRALIDHQSRVGLHTAKNWVVLNDIGFKVVETFETYPSEGDYIVNAFFEDDHQPPSQLQIDRAGQIYQWQREELLAGIETLSPEIMTRMLPGQRWNINGILNHIGRVELWYLSILGLQKSETSAVLHNPFRLLEASYNEVQAALPALAGSADLFTELGETWTARKFLRRLLWHQRDHIEHIKQLIHL